MVAVTETHERAPPFLPFQEASQSASQTPFGFSSGLTLHLPGLVSSCHNLRMLSSGLVFSLPQAPWVQVSTVPVQYRQRSKKVPISVK